MISIIIPVYNHEAALKRCLTSIARQAYQDVEIIIVDDGSDIPLNPLATYFQLPKLLCRVERISHGGAPRARNHGFRQSRGEYVLFCDADVEMKPDMLEKMKRSLDAHPEAGYAYSCFRFGWKKFTLFPFDAGQLKKNNFIHTTSLMRREVFPGFDENLSRFQDWDLWLTMLERGTQGIWIPEVLFSVSPGGTMSRWLPRAVYAIASKTGLSIKRVDAYNRAKEHILKKHKIS